MPPERATQLYTGNHWHVEAAILAEVQHFMTFAVRCLHRNGLVVNLCCTLARRLPRPPATAQSPDSRSM